MLTKEFAERGTIVRVKYKESGAIAGQIPIVAAAAVANGRADVVDAEGQIIKPTLLGIQQGRRVVEMLAIDPGPRYPFFILPQAPQNDAIAAKILPR